VPADARQAAEHGLLAGVGAALDELHHGDLQAVAQRARGDAEGGRGLALAVAGVDQQHAALWSAAASIFWSTTSFLRCMRRLVARVLALGFGSHGFTPGMK
jgi:hypothetical protein